MFITIPIYVYKEKHVVPAAYKMFNFYKKLRKLSTDMGGGVPQILRNKSTTSSTSHCVNPSPAGVLRGFLFLRIKWDQVVQQNNFHLFKHHSLPRIIGKGKLKLIFLRKIICIKQRTSINSIAFSNNQKIRLIVLSCVWTGCSNRGVQTERQRDPVRGRFRLKHRIRKRGGGAFLTGAVHFGSEAIPFFVNARYGIV